MFSKNKKSQKIKERLKILKVNCFERFILNYKNYYVDKSLWLKEVIECKNRIQIFTRPRNMGKSLNLSML